MGFGTRHVRAQGARRDAGAGRSCRPRRTPRRRSPAHRDGGSRTRAADRAHRRAIVMAGRTGAAFAAQLGTMNTNQEIDALATMGISPTEFLVLPRMLALIAMMPLLTIYADLVGILGGAVVGIGMLGLGSTEYIEQTRAAVHVSDFLIGITKSSVFGVVVALAGCLRGIQSGRSAAAVGLAATSAVVTSIVWLIVLDGIFAVILNVLGF